MSFPEKNNFWNQTWRNSKIAFDVLKFDRWQHVLIQFNIINKLYYIIYYNIIFTSSYELWHGLVIMTIWHL